MTQQNNALTIREQNNQISTNRAQDIDIFRLGQAFAQSGYFQDAREQAQAVVKIIYGQELGISPAASMSGIHIISGKPVLSATALAGLIKSRRPGYDYKVLKLDDESCELEFFESGEPVGKSSFSMVEAKQAELTNGKNANWKKYPRNMLFARAISNGARLYCPDILVGSPIYTPDEMGGKVDADGDIVLDPTNDYKAAKQPAALSAQVGNLFDDEKDAIEIEALLDESDEETLQDDTRTREKIRVMMKAIGINPTLSINKFLTLTDPAAKKQALAKTRGFFDREKPIRDSKIHSIHEVLISWNLDAFETVPEFLARVTGDKSFADISDRNSDFMALVGAKLLNLPNEGLSKIIEEMVTLDLIKV